MKGWGLHSHLKTMGGKLREGQFSPQRSALSHLLPPGTSWKDPEPLRGKLRLQKPLTALPSQMLALDRDVKVGRPETRGCSCQEGPLEETQTGALGVSLKATKKELCSNAGS